MENKRERAHDIAEEGLDKIVEGDTKAGEKLIDKAKKIDPKAVAELAEEVERDKENAERFVNKGQAGIKAVSVRSKRKIHFFVLAGRDPAIHVTRHMPCRFSWIPGTRPGKTIGFGTESSECI